MKLTVYADKIFYYEEAIAEPDKVVELLELTDELLTDSDAITKWNSWESSKKDAVYIYGKQKHVDGLKVDSSSENVKWIYQTLSEALHACGRDYSSSLGIEYVDPSPISISKYQKGAEMGPHVDWHGDTMVEPLMSAVLYLNDDYEGGELDFPDLGVTIKPKAGSIIIFPSVAPFYHQSLIVKSGFKYMSPAFWIKRL